jgi:hypothetical protein
MESDWVKIIQNNLNMYDDVDVQSKISIIIPLIQRLVNLGINSLNYLNCVNLIIVQCNLSDSVVRHILKDILEKMGSLFYFCELSFTFVVCEENILLK